MKKLALLVALGFVFGCTYNTSDPEDEGMTPEELGVALDALTAYNELTANGIEDNGIQGNGIQGNGIQGNGLDVQYLAPGVLAALQDTGSTGPLARKLTKYLTSCALASGGSFDFSWNDGTQHDESYPGGLGLADGWRTRGLTADEKAWVSACVIARVNKFGVTVHISMRGLNGALTTTTQEETDYNHKEGAFTGDIFSGTPAGSSCYVDSEVTYATSKNRACASGDCGSVTSVGSCSSACTAAANSVGYSDCFGTDKFIVTYLGDAS